MFPVGLSTHVRNEYKGSRIGAFVLNSTRVIFFLTSPLTWKKTWFVTVV